MSIRLYYNDWVKPSDPPRGVSPRPSTSNFNHDILVIIFSFLISTNNPFASTKDILNVSKVCRLWREAALDTPWLWTHISFSFFRRGQEHPQATILLSRSRNLPINVRMQAVRPLSKDELSTLQTHAHRFRSIELTASSVFLMHFLLKEIDNIAKTGIMSKLELFDFNVVGGSGFKFKRNHQGFIPREDNVSYFLPLINDVVFNYAGWNTTGLTSLELHHISTYGRLDADVFRNMLAGCSNTLQSFTWVGLCPDWDVAVVPPVTLPALRKLYIGYVNDIEPLIYLMDTVVLATCTFHNIVSFYDIDQFKPGVLWTEGNVASPNMSMVWELLTAYQLTNLAIIGEKSLLGPSFSQFLRSQTSLQTLALYEVGRAYHKAFFDPNVQVNAFLPNLKRLLVTSELNLTDLCGWLDRRVTHQLGQLDSITTTPQTLFRIHQNGFFPLMGSCVRLVKEIREPVYKSREKFCIGPEKMIMKDGQWAVHPATSP